MSNATIRVTFGNGADTVEGAHLSAEIDARPAGLNGGVTGFVAGDSVYFLVYRSDNVTVASADASAGSVALHLAGVTITKTEELQFEDAESASLSVPADSISTVEWFGRSLGDLTLQADSMTVRAASRGLAIARVTYTATADAYVLRSPASINGETDFSILVLIVGEVAP